MILWTCYLQWRGGDERLEKYKLTLPISESTINLCMRKLGCTYERHKQSYYNDGNERPDVVESRKAYIVHYLDASTGLGL